jgi:predicted nucleotidyltransferase
MEDDAITDSITSKVEELLGSDYRVTLIGSRAKGTARSGSDFDFLISGPDTISLQTLAELKAYADELPTLAKIDIIDEATASADFLTVAKTNI